jgi:predicted Zn-dependent protease
VEQVGRRVASVSHRRGLPYRFTVLDSPIVNAFALPGGGIYVTRGLLAYLNSEAELAAVLGHEVGHVTARHGAQAVTRVVSYQILAGLVTALDKRLEQLRPISDATAGLIFLKYGRDAEYQADELGLGYAAKAGYDPRWLGAFLRTLDALARGRASPPEFLSTHPSTPGRIARAERLASKLAALRRASLEVGSRSYKEHLDGLVFGPGPYGWLWSDRRLANQAYRISLKPPEGWSVKTQRLAFRTGHPRLKGAWAEWRIHEKPKARSLETFARGIERRLRLPKAPLRPFDLGPIEGRKAVYIGQKASLIFYYGLDSRAGYTLAAVVPSGSERQLVYLYDGLAASVRSLSPEEASALPVQRVSILRARPRERLGELVERVYGDKKHLKAIALLNGLAKDAVLPEGYLVKVVLPSPEMRRPL